MYDMESDSPQHQPAVKVRFFRVFGRRFSGGHDRVHQEAARNDGDSTDSDQSSEERDSSGGRGRRTRCKKGGSAESNNGESSSSGGDGCNSASCSSSSQRGVGSSSDSGSSNGDNSPSSMRVSSSGATGWGSDGYLSGIMIPVTRQSSDLDSCKDTPIRRQHLSAFRKVFQGLSLSSSSLSLSPSRSGGGGSGGSSGRSSGGGNSSGDGSGGGGGGGGGREDHRVQRRHHHHHNHHQHHSTCEDRERGSNASCASGNLAESETSTGTGTIVKDGGKRAKKSPRRILRSPVSYTYLRGMSGLPTQRVPRHRLQGVNSGTATGIALINGYEL